MKDEPPAAAQQCARDADPPPAWEARAWALLSIATLVLFIKVAALPPSPVRAAAAAGSCWRAANPRFPAALHAPTPLL